MGKTAIISGATGLAGSHFLISSMEDESTQLQSAMRAKERFLRTIGE